MGNTTYRDLYETIARRRRPEDVAQMILDLQGEVLNRKEYGTLDKAARRSARRMLSFTTSMMEDFARPQGMERQVRVAEEIFRMEGTLSTAECADPEMVEAFLRALNDEIYKGFGYNEYKHHRLNRQMRESVGLGEMSRRRYNKIFRLLTRMERKLKTLIRELKKYEYTRIGKSGLATRITWEAFEADENAACFIAYYTARKGMRSEFTILGQQRPFDEIANMLFERCLQSETTNWLAIAHVFSDGRVLDRLDDQQKGELLASWFGVLKDIAGFLREIWSTSKIDARTMIVRRGNDSTTWNNTASAWNEARRHWMALLHALGLSEVLDVLCPGKVPRLMAADVAAWHRASGGSLHPDTLVWDALPFPWQVLEGSLECTRQDVEDACARFGVNARRHGWTEPMPTTVTTYRPTPELVHGVAVGDPELARLLRKSRWFSGKDSKPVMTDEEFRVERDEHGFATGVKSPDDDSR